MSVWISHRAMTSYRTGHRAVPVDGGWEVSWLPGRVLGRDQAITGMALAETISDPGGDGRTPLLEMFAAELGLSGPDALTRITSIPAPNSATGKST